MTLRSWLLGIALAVFFLSGSPSQAQQTTARKPATKKQAPPALPFPPTLPKPGPPTPINAELGLRSATQETPQGIVYTVSKGGQADESLLFAFDTKTEKAIELGPAQVG